MFRRLPILRQIVQRRRLARLAREAPSRSAAEHAEAVRRLIDLAQANQ